MSNTVDAEDEPPVVPVGGRLPVDRPWLWLERGWGDFVRTPAIGLTYGTALVAASWLLVLLVATAGWIYLLLPLTAGFFIVGPVLVAGLYETSRRLERGEPVSLKAALFGWRAAGQIALMGAVLLMIHLVWIRIALLLYPLFFKRGEGPSFEALPSQILDATVGLAIGAVIGAGLALVSFCVTAVSIPMLVDQRVSVIEAVVTSLTVVRNNPRVMLFWAMLIVVFIGMGLATFFFGLALAAPVIAHATWHAYRDTVDREEHGTVPRN